MAKAASTSETLTPTQKKEAGETVEYFGFEYEPLTSREGAATAIWTTRDNRGRVLRRRFESYKGPTKSTDPKTGSHGH